MMFVFGEVREPLEETTQLVEEIVRAQMVRTIIQSISQAAKRGSKYLTVEDVIFLIRHDRHKTNRLRTFLSWKDVRKNAKDSKDSGAQGVGVDPEELAIEEAEKQQAAGGSLAAGVAGSSSGLAARGKRSKVKFSWEPFSVYTSLVSDDEDDDMIDEEEALANEEQIVRLRIADQMTAKMTKEEYLYYSECRQASFTFKKVKKFNAWLETNRYYDSKLPSDVLDVMGFLAYEIVSTIIEKALAIKQEWDAEIKQTKRGSSQSRLRSSREGALLSGLLFDAPDDAQAPLEPSHIHEAYRRLQLSQTPLGNFRAGMRRKKASFI
eukprot:jgi/Hompol1/929/HPOL_005469-RA